MIKYYHDEGNNNNKVSLCLIHHALMMHSLWKGKDRMHFVKVLLMLFVHSFPLSRAKMVIYIESDCTCLNSGCVLRPLRSSILS